MPKEEYIQKECNECFAELAKCMEEKKKSCFECSDLFEWCSRMTKFGKCRWTQQGCNP